MCVDFSHPRKGNKFNAAISSEIDEVKAIYEQAEQNYKTLSRRYIISWSFVVAFYACILMTIPVNEIWHGRRDDASNWPTLFKAAYANVQISFF